MNLLTTSAVARLLDMSPDNVRYHQRCGHLLAIRVDSGRREPMRLFLREDVERFQRQREAQGTAVPAGASDV